jgi:hypothetical protein
LEQTGMYYYIKELQIKKNGIFETDFHPKINLAIKPSNAI